MAAMPNALRQASARHGVEDAVADVVGGVPDDLPATRCHDGVDPAPGGRQLQRAQVPSRRRLPGGGPRGTTGVHPDPESGVDEGVVQQPHQTTQP